MSRQTLSKRELEDLHAVLRRAAEHNRRLGLLKDEDAKKLAAEVKALSDELAGH